MKRQCQVLFTGQRIWWVRLSRPPRAIVLAAIILLGASLLWVDTAAPPVVGFAVTVAMAAAWCRWLERHTETSAFPEVKAPAARADFFSVGGR
jgi:hypothetical protein